MNNWRVYYKRRRIRSRPEGAKIVTFYLFASVCRHT